MVRRGSVSGVEGEAGKLIEGKVYVSEEHDFLDDWLSEEIAADDSGVAPLVKSKGDWLP